MRRQPTSRPVPGGRATSLVVLALIVTIGGSPRALAQPNTDVSRSDTAAAAAATPVVPTVAVPAATPVPVPTLTMPRKRHHRSRHTSRLSNVTWIWAFLTSYCPGTAGWTSANGSPVFYGMLANDYYPFGTRVYIPVLGLRGVVEDRFGGYHPWNDFDVWSPVCYSTPTGWFKVAIHG